MKYRSFGKIDFAPSALGFGAMRLPCIGGGNAGSKVDFELSTRMIRYAVDHGVNYLDTAYRYHDGISEVALSKAIKDGYRQKVMLADKSPVFLMKKESEFDSILDEQLTALGVEHIDFYLLHALNARSFEKIVQRFDIISKAERAKKEGKIGHIGFSFHDNFEAFDKILNAYDGWEFCQIQLNYLDTDRQAGLKGLRAAAQKGLAVVVMEPLLGGKLAAAPKDVLEIMDQSANKRTPVEWALDYLWDMPEVSIVLSGMSTMQQTVENVGYADRAKPGMLSTEDKRIIEKVIRQFESKATVPCTACGYCLPCPNGVSIPDNFAAYNELFMYDDPSVANGSYENIKFWQGERALAASCVSCGICEEKCPQKIAISEKMTEVARAFAGKK
jgi:predicted aldo/keto reductase-like oxidoreductase